MRYYTKEWYDLTQKQHYTLNLTPVPDRAYSKKELQAFYQQDLAAFLEQERAVYEEPPTIDWAEDLLLPGKFCPEMFCFTDEATGEHFHPQTPEIARKYLEAELERRMEQFQNRPPFDLQGEIQCFRECYQNKLRYSWKQYPHWAQELLDRQLLALDRVPQSIYDRLKSEEDANRAALISIEAEARRVLIAQEIPERIRSQFHFHDSSLLYLKKHGKNWALTMNVCFGWPQSADTPYTRVTFRQVSAMEREPGLVLRPRKNSHGELSSNCQYLYDELYKTDNGYKVHMLLWTRKGLRELTICCADITFENNLLLFKED